MALSFVDTLADALGVWDDFSITINSNNGREFDGTPFDYYNLLSWSGELVLTDDYRTKSFEYKTHSNTSRNAESGIVLLNAPLTLNLKGSNNCE